MSNWRPIHHELSADSEFWINEHGQKNVHLALVTDDDPQKFRTACTKTTIGEWITGKGSQVTCDECKEFVHA